MGIRVMTNILWISIFLFILNFVGLTMYKIKKETANKISYCEKNEAFILSKSDDIKNMIFNESYSSQEQKESELFSFNELLVKSLTECKDFGKNKESHKVLLHYINKELETIVSISNVIANFENDLPIYFKEHIIRKKDKWSKIGGYFYRSFKGKTTLISIKDIAKERES